MKVKIQTLRPGQEVGIANCVTLAKVIRRVAKNLYLLSWKGQEVTVLRSQISVLNNGRYQFGPVNASL